MAAETQQIVRLVETNIDGRKSVEVAIRSVTGVSFMLSNAIVKASGFKLGLLLNFGSSRLQIKRLVN